MSIAKIQDKILSQKGCGTAIGIGTAIIMSFYIFSSCARGQMYGDSSNNSQTVPTDVVKVGDVSITTDQIQQGVTTMLQRSPSVNFSSTAQETSSVITNLLNSAAYQFIAKRDHIETNDTAIMKAADTALDQEMDMMKMQLQLKTGASKADFDAAFKKQRGETPEEAKKKALASLKEGIGKPDIRAKVLNELIVPLVQNAETASSKPSDQEVKASYDSYAIKRILITRNSVTDPKGTLAKSKADQALKVVQGGMPFEQAMAKFSSEPPRPGKSVGDSVMNIPRNALSMQPNFKALDGQKVGFVSPVEEGPEGYNIYKITAISNNAPPDFNKNIETYKKQYVQNQIQSKLTDEVKGILASKDVKWENKGYQALYDYSNTFSMNPGDRDAALKKISDEAQQDVKNPAEKQPALMAWFEAETGLYEGGGPNKAALIPGRIDVLNEVLDNNEDYDLRVELADLYTQQKKGPEALQALVLASQSNTDYADQGQKRFGDLAAKADGLVKAKLVTDDKLKPFYDAQAQWKKNKADNDAQDAAMSAQMAQQKLKDAANEKANEEAMKKQKAEVGKSSTPAPSTTPTPAKPSAAPAPSKPAVTPGTKP